MYVPLFWVAFLPGRGTKLKIVPILNELKAHFSRGLCPLLADYQATRLNP